MSGTMFAGLLAAVLIGPEAEAPRYAVRIDHTSVRFFEGEAEPDPQLLCQVEVLSSPDGTFDTRTQFGRETIEFSGVISDAENGKLRGEVHYVHLEEVESNSVEMFAAETGVELSPDEPVVLGNLMSKSMETVKDVQRTRVNRAIVTLSVRPESEIRDRRRAQREQ